MVEGQQSLSAGSDNRYEGGRGSPGIAGADCLRGEEGA